MEIHKETIFEGHHCSEEEITKEKYDLGFMYICPPVDKIHVFDNYNNVPSIMGGFRIYPKEYKDDNKNVVSESSNDHNVSDFILTRM